MSNRTGIGSYGEKRVALAVSTHDFVSSEEALAWLRESASEGWICFTDRVEHLHDGGRGVPLSGEARVSEDASRQLRYDGTWHGWTYREVPGDTHLVDDQDLLAAAQSAADGGDCPTHASYRVYWALQTRAHDVRVWEPAAARFTGWKFGGR